MDDTTIRQIVAGALGERFQDFREEGPATAMESMKAHQSLLYSLEKGDLIRILEITQIFSSTISPWEALHSLVKKVTEILQVSHCSLILLDSAHRTGRVAISHEGPNFEGVDISLENYPEILRSLQTGEITIVKNPSKDPLMHSLRREQIQKIRDVSIMVLPLLFRETVFGVLLVRKQWSEEGFTIREVRICQLMVSMVLAALQRMCEAASPGGAGSSRGAEAGEEEDRRFLEALFSLGPVGVLLVDGEGIIRRANPKAEELLGISLPDLVGTPFRRIVPDEWIERIRRMRKEGGNEGASLSRYHFNLRGPEGESKTLSVERRPFPGPEKGSLVFFRDVTKEKEMEAHLQRQSEELRSTNLRLQEARSSLLGRNEELEKTNERLEELNKTKTYFLAMATHEIRTPLNIIMGYNRFLLSGKAGRVNPEQKRILEESIQSCERLLNIVNDMLDFSRIESGMLELRSRRADLTELLKRVYRQMKLISDRGRIDLVLRLPEAPLELEHDPDRIEQVLVNLISNAIKFTHAGGNVTVAARKRAENGTAVAEVSVSDTGVGLSPSVLKMLFRGDRPFVSSLPDASRAKGAGLGLAISKRIVEAHGGRIWAEGREGEGAKFVFTLPFDTRETRG